MKPSQVEQVLSSSDEQQFCKYLDGAVQAFKFFVENPKYEPVTDEMVKEFAYVPPKCAREFHIKTFGAKDRTSLVVSALEVVAKNNIELSNEYKNLLMEQGIDLQFEDIRRVAKLCDNLIKNDRIEEFELLYHYGNLKMGRYLAYSIYPAEKFVKYLEDLTIVDKDEVRLVSQYRPESLAKIISTRRLKLSNEQLKNLGAYWHLQGPFSSLNNEECQFFEVLLKYGAVSLTIEQAKKIYEHSEQELEIIDKLVLTSTCANAKTVFKNPFESGVSQKIATEIVKTKKENESKKQQQAEIEMDKIFAEAQKNIEMER